MTRSVGRLDVERPLAIDRFACLLLLAGSVLALLGLLVFAFYAYIGTMIGGLNWAWLVVWGWVALTAGLLAWHSVRACEMFPRPNRKELGHCLLRSLGLAVSFPPFWHLFGVLP